MLRAARVSTFAPHRPIRHIIHTCNQPLPIKFNYKHNSRSHQQHVNNPSKQQLPTSCNRGHARRATSGNNYNSTNQNNTVNRQLTSTSVIPRSTNQPLHTKRRLKYGPQHNTHNTNEHQLISERHQDNLTKYNHHTTHGHYHQAPRGKRCNSVSFKCSILIEHRHYHTSVTVSRREKNIGNIHRLSSKITQQHSNTTTHRPPSINRHQITTNHVSSRATRPPTLQQKVYHGSKARCPPFTQSTISLSSTTNQRNGNFLQPSQLRQSYRTSHHTSTLPQNQPPHTPTKGPSLKNNNVTSLQCHFRGIRFTHGYRCHATKGPSDHVNNFARWVSSNVVRLYSFSVNCTRGELLSGISTSFGEKRLATLVNEGNAKGSALLHTVTKLGRGCYNGVLLSKRYVTGVEAPRGTERLTFIAARHAHVTGLQYRSIITVNHTPCAG